MLGPDEIGERGSGMKEVMGRGGKTDWYKDMRDGDDQKRDDGGEERGVYDGW